MFSTKNLVLTLLVPFLSCVSALPIKREVPQEHSHQQFVDIVSKSLNLNNPDQIKNPVFGLLGNAAATAGQGKIRDTNCLQQATADQAFTNAKAAGDVPGMTGALIYRALERNTDKVGLASVPCTSVTAVNPEIAAIQQHQDPASTGAAATNKAIVLALARQISGIGGNPLDALKSGTFAPGDLGDVTARGNSCNDANDPVGCIITKNLLQPDATIDEIFAAAAGAESANSTTGVAPSDGCASTATNSAATVTAPSESAAPTTARAIPATASTAAHTTPSTAIASPTPVAGTNLQTFNGTLGGFPPPAVTAGGRGFVVADSNDFLNIGAALQRSCNIQHNVCADAANAGGGFSVGQCDKQETQCVAARKVA